VCRCGGDGGGGGDIDELIGSTSYVITGLNSGTADRVGGGFSNIENLTGTSGVDSFAFDDAGSIDGSIDGLGGSDTLTGDDNGNVFVINSPSGGTLADKVAGTFTNIENLVGGGGDDSFIYDRANGAGGDISIDGAGQSAGYCWTASATRAERNCAG